MGKLITKVILGLVMIAGMLISQQPPIYPQQYQFYASPGAQVSITSASQVGVGGGNNAYYYWVVVNYPGGSVLPTNPAYIRNLPELDGSHYVKVSWGTVFGASNYTVLRSVLPNQPSTNCVACVVATVTGNTTNDTGATLTDASITLKNPAFGSVTLDNSGSAPIFNFSPANSNLPGGGGGISSVTSTDPKLNVQTAGTAVTVDTVDVVDTTQLNSAIAPLATSASVTTAITNAKNEIQSNIQRNNYQACIPTSGSGSAYTCALAKPIVSGDLVNGTVIAFIPDVNGTPGAITVTIDGITKSLKEKDGSTNPVAGDVVAGQFYFINYDGTSLRLPGVTGGGGGGSYTAGAGLNLLSNQFSINEVYTATNDGIFRAKPSAFVASNGGAGTSYTGTMAICPAAYYPNMRIDFIPDVNGAGGPTDINICGLGTVSLKLADGVSDPVDTSLVAGILTPIWYTSGGQFNFVNGSSTASGGMTEIVATYATGTGTLTVPSETKFVHVVVCGGGGGASAGTTAQGGSGGGGGGCVERVLDTSVTKALDYSVGAGGTGGPFGGSSTDGTSSTVTFGSITLTGTGGSRGIGSNGGGGGRDAKLTTPTTNGSGANTAGSSPSRLDQGGGGAGQQTNTGLGQFGSDGVYCAGGSSGSKSTTGSKAGVTSLFGVGGAGGSGDATTPTVGSNGTGCSGGGGGGSNGTTAMAGGSGGNGVIQFKYITN